MRRGRESEIETNVGTVASRLMNLDRQHIIARHQTGGGKSVSEICRLIRGSHEQRGERLVVHITHRHVAPHHLGTIEIDDAAIIHEEVHREPMVICRIGHREVVPEIGRDVFIGRIGSVRQDRGLLTGNFTVTKHRRTGSPA